MNHDVQGRFFDGQHSVTYRAVINLDDSHLLITYQNHELHHIKWLLTNIVVVERMMENRSAIISATTAPEARLMFDDKALYEQLMRQIPSRRIQRSQIALPWKILVFCSAFFILGLAALLWGFPKATPYIARWIPQSWDAKLGSWVVSGLSDGKPVCVAPKGLKALDNLVEKLNRASGENLKYQVHVIDFGPEQINALATSGNHIIVMKGLIDFADTPEEFAGVLAHEMGHAIANHPTESLLRVLGVNLILTATFGGNIGLPAQLYHMKYSRESENEADQIAISILNNAGISSAGLARFFEKAKKIDKAEKLGLSDYMSGHPGLDSRIEVIKAQSQVKKVEPAMSAREWRELKGVCGETKVSSEGF